MPLENRHLDNLKREWDGFKDIFGKYPSELDRYFKNIDRDLAANDTQKLGNSLLELKKYLVGVDDDVSPLVNQLDIVIAEHQKLISASPKKAF